MRLVSYIPYAVLFFTFELMLVGACLEKYNVGKDTPLHPMEREQRRMCMERMFFCIQLGLAGMVFGNMLGVGFKRDVDSQARIMELNDVAQNYTMGALVLLLQHLVLRWVWSKDTSARTEKKDILDEEDCTNATTPLLLV